MPNSVEDVRAMQTPEDTLAAVREHVQRIRFGSIALTIHEGRIVQLDVTEKRRLVAR